LITSKISGNYNRPPLSSYKTIPVISCSAPFKAGRNGDRLYRCCAGCERRRTVCLQVRNPGDLYLYGNNNLQAVKIKGSDLKAWLETAAKQFAQINPALTTEQDLVPSYGTIYNYDVFYADNNALQYQIDDQTCRQPYCESELSGQSDC
jgi:2',3'-cyclic-nucleotide 2'-phosphodiesterase/3'-nucleotidase